MALWLSLLFARFDLPVPTSVSEILRANPQLNLRSIREAMQGDIEQLAANSECKTHVLAD